MTEREALIAAVCDNPNDDTVRLVFADWLDENDETERAGFIRKEIASTRVPRVGPRVWTRQVFGTLQQEQRWRAELPTRRGWEWGQFHRGFIDSLIISPRADVVDNIPEIFRATPIWHLELAGGQPILAFLPYLQHVEFLTLSRFRLTGEEVIALACAPHLASLQRLAIFNSVVDDPPDSSALRFQPLRERFGDRFIEVG